MQYQSALRSFAIFTSCASLLLGCAKINGNDGKPDLGGFLGPELDLAVARDGGGKNPDPVFDPLAATLKEVRSVVHVHSVYSHDACDGQGIPGGVRNQGCWNDLRAAVCSTGLQFVSLNDHPAHMNEYSMSDEMLFDAAQGDTPIVDGGNTIGNQLKCPDGHTVIVTEGFENDHALPIAFAKQPVTTGKAYGSFANTNSLAEMQAMVAELRDAGAIIANAHSEEDDVSAQTLLSVGVDAMEWYNPHGNFLTVMGAGDGIGLGALDALNLLGDMSPFLAGASSGAHPDFALMLLLPKWPQKGFDKWREVQRTRTVTGLFGSDVHQNVSIKPLCTGGAALACQLAAAGSSGKTQALALLAAGGLIVMSDGRRLDAYERILRWLENRILVSDVSIAGIKDALKQGRSYGVFSVFGAPEGFRYVGQSAGQVLEMGAAAKGPIALTVRLPKSAQPQGGGAQWTAADATKVELHASLFHTSATETKLIKESTVLGDAMTFTATEPGAYHVEVWQKPKHLSTALGTAASLADREYLWLISNPIRVLPQSSSP